MSDRFETCPNRSYRAVCDTQKTQISQDESTRRWNVTFLRERTIFSPTALLYRHTSCVTHVQVLRCVLAVSSYLVELKLWQIAFYLNGFVSSSIKFWWSEFISSFSQPLSWYNLKTAFPGNKVRTLKKSRSALAFFMSMDTILRKKAWRLCEVVPINVPRF